MYVSICMRKLGGLIALTEYSTKKEKGGMSRTTPLLMPSVSNTTSIPTLLSMLHTSRKRRHSSLIHAPPNPPEKKKLYTTPFPPLNPPLYPTKNLKNALATSGPSCSLSTLPIASRYVSASKTPI